MNILLKNTIWHNGKKVNDYEMAVWTNCRMHPVQKKLLNRNHMRIYQSRRFYMDEYPKVKKYSEDWLFTLSFNKLIDAIISVGISKMKNTVGLPCKDYMAVSNSKDWDFGDSDTGVDNDTITITYNPDWDKEEPDLFFVNRFLKRN